MLNTYFLERAIDVLSEPRVTAGRGRFQTSDPRVQLILSRYPGVSLVSSEDEPASRPLTPAEAVQLHGPGIETVRVSNTVGVQMKPKLPDKWTRGE
jgi:hypothetical protein